MARRRPLDIVLDPLGRISRVVDRKDDPGLNLTAGDTDSCFIDAPDSVVSTLRAPIVVEDTKGSEVARAVGARFRNRSFTSAIVFELHD